VFAHFSMLGDVSRLYLLQTKCLGRCIDIFLNLNNSARDKTFNVQSLENYKAIFRDKSLRTLVPLISHAKEFYIAMDPERSLV